MTDTTWAESCTDALCPIPQPTYELVHAPERQQPAAARRRRREASWALLDSNRRVLRDVCPSGTGMSRWAMCHRIVQPEAEVVSFRIRRRQQSEVYLPIHDRGDRRRVEERITTQAEVNASFRGLITCDSAWACPVCAPRLAADRREELAQILEVAARRRLIVLFVTFTISHQRSDTAAVCLQRLKEARRHFYMSRAWRSISEVKEKGQRARRNDGYLGRVHTIEPAWGENGHHMHAHELILIDPELWEGEPIPRDEKERIKWEERQEGKLRGQWITSVRTITVERPQVLVERWGTKTWIDASRRNRGEQVLAERTLQDHPHCNQHGLHIARQRLQDPEVREHLARYMTKWGLEDELTSARDAKGPAGAPAEQCQPIWELLRLAAANNCRGHWAERWREFARATRGRGRYQTTPGLLDSLGLSREDLDREDDTPAEESSFSLTRHEYHAIAYSHLEVAILEAVERNDLAEFWQVITVAVHLYPDEDEGPPPND